MVLRLRQVRGLGAEDDRYRAVFVLDFDVLFFRPRVQQFDILGQVLSEHGFSGNDKRVHSSA